MHNKLLIADNHAVILGGRNIGDYYFGLSRSYNFHDLDVLGAGPVAQQASAMFDDLWNSTWVVSAGALPVTTDPESIVRGTESLSGQLKKAGSLHGFPIEPRSWTEELTQVTGQLQLGSSRLIYDRIADDQIVEGLTAPLRQAVDAAESEILLVNAYIIPTQHFIDSLRTLTKRGVRVGILTNSLASHDVPAVNSHYQRWRKPLIESGAELYELRADPGIKSQVDTEPTVSKFVGLHTKAFVVDRRQVFVGSFNFDPRSVNINTEMGVLVDSPGLGEAMAAIAQRDMSPENAWQVTTNEAGRLVWTSSAETVTRQPARNWWQRIANGFFKLLPESQL
jgi:putative cardiolipin synthase